MKRYSAASVATAVLVAGCGGAPGTPPPIGGMVLIPAGEFLMGSNKRDDDGLKERYGFTFELFLNEHPAHRVALAAFYIDQLEVTNAQYKAFVLDAGYPEPAEWTQNAYNISDLKLETAHVNNLRWIASDYFGIDQETSTMSREDLLTEMLRIQRARDQLPVSAISWYDAESYCRWRGKHLPTEVQWEKAARGPEGAEYPWGNEWAHDKANTGDQAQEAESLAAVGSYPGDLSQYGVMDLGGNVSEWVADWYLPYPDSDYWEEAFGQQHKVIRGGGAGLGHYALSVFFRSARRAHAPPEMTGTDVGFRCAKDVASASGGR